MDKKYRIIHGISYPNLFQGKEQPVQLSASTNISVREELYNDDAIRLADEDCKAFENQAICVEHDENHKVGLITSAWKDSDGHMRITARIYVDTPEGEAIFNRINNGDLRGLSVGYSVPVTNDYERIGKQCREVSLCETPFFENAGITVTASGKQRNNSINNSTTVERKLLQFEIMADQLEQSKKDSTELVKKYDEMLKEVETMRQQLSEKATLEAKLKQHEEAEEARRAQYAKDKEDTIKKVLEVQKEQFGKDLPEEYVESMAEIISTPEFESHTAVIVASQNAYLQQKETNTQLQTQLDELAKAVTKMQQDGSQFEANYRRLAMTTPVPPPSSSSVSPSSEEPKEITIGASGKPKMSQCFRGPSVHERELYKMATGKDVNLDVNASGSNNNGPQIPPAAVHPFVGAFKKSMRHLPSGKPLFDFLCSRNYDGLESQIKVDTSKVIEN